MTMTTQKMDPNNPYTLHTETPSLSTAQLKREAHIHQMKRFIKFFGAVVFAITLSFVSYIKGHFDGVGQASVTGLIYNLSAFEDLEKHGPDRAKFRLGMWVTEYVNGMNSRGAWLESWLRWRKVNSQSAYERRRSRAEEIANQYRGKLPTLERLKAEFEKSNPGMKIEFDIK